MKYTNTRNNIDRSHILAAVFSKLCTCKEATEPTMAGSWVVSVVTILLCVNTAWCRPAEESYTPAFTGYKVLQLSSDDKQVFSNAMQDIAGRYNLDFWTRRATYAEVMVGPVEFDDVVRRVLTASLQTSVTVNDVQKLLQKDFDERQRMRLDEQPDITDTYLTSAQINEFLERVSTTATNADVTLHNMGKSYEGRDTNYVTIQAKSTGGPRKEKYSIVIDAGMHAREWLSVSMALSIINKLAFNPGNDPDVADMLNMFDWVIAPCVNPDGYDYSFTGVNQRIWRKNRNTEYAQPTPSQCVGVDLNRNFGYLWDPAAGGSTNPCTEIYSGPAPFSERESRNIRDWLASHKSKARLYLNLHVYGEVLLYPYGADANQPREEEHLMLAAGQAFVDATAELGRNYEVGNVVDLFYVASGLAIDYAKGGLGISLSYTPELYPHDSDLQGTWRDGFIQPASKITPVVESTWPGFKAMARRAFQEYGYPPNSA